MVSWYSCSLVLNSDSVSSIRLPRLPSWESLKAAQRGDTFIIYPVIYALLRASRMAAAQIDGDYQAVTGLTGSAASPGPSAGQALEQAASAMEHGRL